MKTAILSILLLTSISAASANTCSRGDIDHYLKNGFTHQQVVDLCGKKKATPQAQAAAPVAPVATSNLSTEENIYFKSALEASKVKLQADQLIYISNECMEFGLEDMMGEKERVCRDVETTVSYQGLELLKAQKAILLIQDRMLLMKGTFSRKLVKPESIIPRHKEAFFEDFQTNPQTVDIPTRKGFEPHEVGQRLISKS